MDVGLARNQSYNISKTGYNPDAIFTATKHQVWSWPEPEFCVSLCPTFSAVHDRISAAATVQHVFCLLRLDFRLRFGCPKSKAIILRYHGLKRHFCILWIFGLIEKYILWYAEIRVRGHARLAVYVL
jgi:hypothetical protein